jgi:hypothetical protein
VGTVSLSFSADSREAFDSLAPPQDQPYLANMAVDPKFRRYAVCEVCFALSTLWTGIGVAVACSL